MNLIALANVEYRYVRGGFTLRLPQLNVAAGEKVGLVGPSGSGKTTLISVIAGILPAQRGSVQVAGHDLLRLSEARRRAFRIAHIGFVFQEFELVDYLNVRENVLLPYYLNATLRLTRDVQGRAEDLLRAVGMSDKLRRQPRSLSQGERQRAALCRALITQPALLIADEPTGNLDEETAASTIGLLTQAVAERGTTLLVVTHQRGLLAGFDRVLDVRALARGAVA